MNAAPTTLALANDAQRGSHCVQRFVSHPSIVTDSLGFRLELTIIVEDMDGRGQHKTYEQEGRVTPDASHKIIINANLRDDELAEVIAHEAYHLFYSARHLVAVDEETEAEVFGQLVKHIHATARMANTQIHNREQMPEQREL